MAISAGTSPNLASSGLLVQVPLVALAFLISVPAALLLFLAATLTPVLTGAGLDPQSLIFIAVILILGLLSFAHRANQVRQLRNLEALSRANQRAAREAVRGRRYRESIGHTLTSVIHGTVQGALLAAQSRLSQGKVTAQDITSFQGALSSAVTALTQASSPGQRTKESTVGLQDLLDLWRDAVTIDLAVTDSAHRALTSDPALEATTLDVLGEATTNALKYGKTAEVTASLSVEGASLRIEARNRVGDSRATVALGERLGLAYLREVTTRLDFRLVGDHARLVAEIPLSSDDLELAIKDA